MAMGNKVFMFFGLCFFHWIQGWNYNKIDYSDKCRNMNIGASSLAQSASQQLFCPKCHQNISISSWKQSHAQPNVLNLYSEKTSILLKFLDVKVGLHKVSIWYFTLRTDHEWLVYKTGVCVISNNKEQMTTRLHCVVRRFHSYNLLILLGKYFKFSRNSLVNYLSVYLY